MKVIDNRDPLKMGRIKTEEYWLMPLLSIKNFKNFGFYIPKIDSEVDCFMGKYYLVEGINE